MKKSLTRLLLGALILFVWQFMSWAALNFHQKAQQHTPQQDSILAYIQGLGLEEGQYLMPQPGPGATAEKQQEFMREQEGKPWAMLAVHYRNQTSMWMPMLRGYLVDILIVWMLFALLDALLRTVPRGRRWTMSALYSMTVGLIGYFAISYTNFIWYQSFDILASLMDGVVPWALLGALHGAFWCQGDQAKQAQTA